MTHLKPTKPNCLCIALCKKKLLRQRVQLLCRWVASPMLEDRIEAKSAASFPESNQIVVGLHERPDVHVPHELDLPV